MPTLKQLTCQIEWANSNVPFKEYDVKYKDGVVESYIAIPDSSAPFSISLKSTGYIAPGLAMFVFMDGIYQCNRNRDDLRPIYRSPEASRKFRDISFRVRQKEERLPDGGWIGRPWRFEPFQLVDSVPDNPDIVKQFEELGTIRVVVLRCMAHPKARITRDDDLLDGAYTPESGMAIHSGDEDDESVSSEETSIYEEPSGGTQEMDDAFGGAFAGLFDGPCRDGCCVERPLHHQSRQQPYHQPHQQPFEQCCPSCHHPSDSPHAREQYTPGHNGGRCQHPWHTQHPPAVQQPPITHQPPIYHQPPVVEPHYYANHTLLRSSIDPPIIPQCHATYTTHSPTTNPHWHSGRQKVQHNIPRHTCEDDCCPSSSRNSHAHKVPSSSQPAVNVSYGDPQGDNRVYVPSVVLNINPQQLAESHAQSQRGNGKQDPVDNGYYVISDGKRVPEKSSGGLQANNSANTCCNEGNSGRRKSRKGKRKSNKNDKGDQQQNNSNNQDGKSQSGQNNDGDWGVGNNNDQGQDNSPSGWGENNDWGNNDNSQPGRDGGHNSGNWPPPEDSGANGNDNKPGQDWLNNVEDNGNSAQDQAKNNSQKPPMQQISKFDLFSGLDQPLYVSPMSTEPAKDEPPLYTVPESVAKENSLSHQVQLGSHAKYIHRIRTPEYQDTMENPYALFIFKYRTADVIEKMFNTTVTLDINDERKKLESLPRAEIVNQLLRAQTLLANSGVNSNNIKNTRSTASQSQQHNQTKSHWASSAAANDNSSNTNDWNRTGGGSPSARQSGWDNSNSAGGGNGGSTWDKSTDSTSNPSWNTANGNNKSGGPPGQDQGGEDEPQW
ncbi:hypothetical protein AJ79_03852 [Helicocarpus griseus UAMH5409]|uniref:DUF7918 domain-containing protein n=1 Tax=Helicocarpus griseus UAMH5409 TaxID=1447875 RepID=A0A2B7XW16_9EURO|nr:hypothetical protein AJ79_03852 [Helicocarpus griseus UAMH5409]